MALEEGLATYETPQEQIANFLQVVRQALRMIQDSVFLERLTIQEARRFMNTFDKFKDELNLDDNEVKWALQGILELRIGLMREMSKLGSGHEHEKLNLYRKFIRGLDCALKQIS